MSISKGVGPLPVVWRTGGDRAVAGAGSWCARDRAAAGSQPVDDLAGAASERVDADVAARVQGVGRAVARRASCLPTEGGQAGREPAALRVCAGAALGCGARWRRSSCRAAGAEVERPEQAASWRSSLGAGLEPGTDREPAAGRVPDDPSMQISHEAIYQALYVQGRGALKRELVACLRTGRA